MLPIFKSLQCNCSLSPKLFCVCVTSNGERKRGAVPVADSSMHRPSLRLRCRSIACQDGDTSPWYSIKGPSEDAGEDPRVTPKVLLLLLLSIDRKNGCTVFFALKLMLPIEEDTVAALLGDSCTLLLLGNDNVFV